MKNLTFTLFLTLLVLLPACRSSADDITVTPPVIAAATPTTKPTATPTAVPLEPTSEVMAEPTEAPAEEKPTATLTPTAITPPPTPTLTPIPVAPVTRIHLALIVDDELSRPVFLTHAFDDRLFVVEKRGRIRIIENGRLRPQPFLDIQDRVSSEKNEQGLFSVAFHPQYASNGRFFINYTNLDGATVIARYQVSADDPNQAGPASEAILLTINQPYGNHNGGQLQFGPDGYLYVGMGDGGGAGDPHDNGQNPGTLLGAMLRLDVNYEGDAVYYAIPATNPFVNDDTRRNEIWATGLRNPWRFSFDRLTGDLYIADVGQDEWEEVHFQPAHSPGGENYGWNIMEGNHCYRGDDCDMAGLELPIAEYGHEDGSCSITGGYVYRGRQFPSLYGNYFYADFCSGFIWSLLRQADGAWVVNRVLKSGRRIASFGEDVAGELYVVDHRGTILQIQPPTTSHYPLTTIFEGVTS